MQLVKNKTAAISIAIFLIISMGASMLLIPSANAHTPPYQITTYAKIEAVPNPIGVGQSALCYAFLGNAPLSGSTIENTFRNHNYTVTITSPNGTVLPPLHLGHRSRHYSSTILQIYTNHYRCL